MVVSGKAEVGHEPDLLREPVVVGRDGASLERIEKFGGVKAKDFRAAKVSDHPPTIGTPEGVRCIEQQVQPVPLGDFFELIDGTRASPDVDTKNPSGLICDETLDQRGVQEVSDGIDVAEDRLDLLPLKRVRGRDKSHGRDDHLTRHRHCTNGDLESYRCVAHRYAVLYAKVFRQSCFQLLNTLSMVREPTGVENPLNPFGEVGSVANVRLPDDQLSVESGRCTPQSEFVNGFAFHD
jgi:hypothetical protein